MDHEYDVAVIGTGTSAYMLAYPCRSAGKSVVMIDSRPYGGTCAMRGCQPKKYFVVQAELSRLAQHLAGKGVATPPTLAWSDVAAFKNEFTTAVPGNTEAYFARIGASLYRGTARFREAGILEVGQDVLKGEAIVLATGARPRQLDVPGGELALDSNAFLALTELPSSLIFIGGGYISFEFAHVAAAFGAKVRSSTAALATPPEADSTARDTTRIKVVAWETMTTVAVTMFLLVIMVPNLLVKSCGE